MKKVGPSEAEVVDDNACLLVKGSWPTADNLQVSKVMQGLANHVPSQKPLSPMFLDLLGTLGVPKDVANKYKQKISSGTLRSQHMLVGLADYTKELPVNKVFLTGTINANGTAKMDAFSECNKVLVTRFPCLGKNDALLLTVVKSMPDGMCPKDWEALCSLEFGGIVFSNPRGDCIPLPQLCANGDLDGDLYLVLWKQTILSSITTDCGPKHVHKPPEEDQSKLPPFDKNWLTEGQRKMCDVQSLVDRGSLIGKLYGLRRKASIKGNHHDASLFGVAFKEAIDTGKHGGAVNLPARLWKQVPANLHSYLCIPEPALAEVTR